MPTHLGDSRTIYAPLQPIMNAAELERRVAHPIAPSFYIWDVKYSKVYSKQWVEDILQRAADHGYLWKTLNLNILRYYLHRSSETCHQSSANMTIRDVKLLFDELAKWRVQSSCSHWQKSNLPPQLPPREMVAAARFLYWYKYRTKAKILEQIEVLKLQWLCDEPMVPTEKIPAFWKGFKNTYDQTTNHLKGSMYPASTLWIEGNGVSSNDGPDFHFTDQITMAKPEKQQKTGSGNSLIELAAKDPIDCVIGDDKAQDDGKEEAAESHVDQQADQDKGKMEDDDEDREGYLLKPPEFYREMGDSIWADLEPRIEAKIQNMVDKTLQHMVNQKVNRKVERVVFDVMTRYIERRKRKREEEGDSPTAEDWDRLFSQV